MNRRQLGWAGLGLGALAAGVGVGLSRRSEQLAADDPMEAFWALELATPSGAQLPVRSLRGRPLVLNFWATWCPPCVKEMPELDRFAREFSNATSLIATMVVVLVIGILIDGLVFGQIERRVLAKRGLAANAR